MASLLENLFDYLENERHQDAAKIREKAQEELFKAKNKLGLQERKETGKIDALFSSLEKGHQNDVKSLLDKAREEYKKHISAYVHVSITYSECFSDINGNLKEFSPLFSQYLSLPNGFPVYRVSMEKAFHSTHTASISSPFKLLHYTCFVTWTVAGASLVTS